MNIQRRVDKDDIKRHAKLRLRNIVNENAKMSSMWRTQSKTKQKYNSKQTTMRIQRSQTRKDKIHENFVENALKFLNRWDDYRFNKKVNEEYSERMKKCRMFINVWLRYSFMHQIIKNIANRYNTYKKKCILDLRVRW